MVKIMSAGPTQVRENVRIARSLATTNPDLDPAFYSFYEDTTKKLQSILHTTHDIHILCGEGILGLEAAIASLTQPNDRILVIENGIFGEGFADFVKLYGGDVVFFRGNRQKGIDMEALKSFLECDHNFTYATLVHCDTPSGVLNDIASICPLLHQYGILSVVDSVAAMFATELRIDEWNIDIVCGGSQKALSVPPGLTMISISDDAWTRMEERTIPIAGFYVNLLNFKHVLRDQWFPYTMPISDIYGLAKGIDNFIEDPTILKRHEHIATNVRSTLLKAGLTLYLTEDYAPSVTVINVPKDINANQLLFDIQHDFAIIISGCFGYLKDRVIRIGHMGENCNIQDVADTLYALQMSLQKQGYICTCNMRNVFLDSL